MTRRCPNCGADVPDNSINCPRCFTDVPRDVRTTEPQNTYGSDGYGGRTGNGKSRGIMILLAVIPPFFGFLGLGQIYRDSSDRIGWILLAAGLVLYVLLAAMVFLMVVSGPVGVLVAIPAVMVGALYFLAALTAFFDAYTGVLGILRYFR